MKEFSVASRCKVSRDGSRCTKPSASSEKCPAPQILERLYRREREGIYGYFARRVGPDLASDLTQEVFLRAATSAHLPRIDNPAGFLRRIARNLLIDRFRKMKCKGSIITLRENFELPCGAEQEESIIARDAEQIMSAALSGLSPKTVRIFKMSRFEQKSYREIHCELGIALATVDYHMMRALACLRDAFRASQ